MITSSTNPVQLQLNRLMSERRLLLKDEQLAPLVRDALLDTNERMILSSIAINSPDLDVAAMLYALDLCGYAPCLINNDNGGWAISPDSLEEVECRAYPIDGVRPGKSEYDAQFVDSIDDACGNFAKEMYNRKREG